MKKPKFTNKYENYEEKKGTVQTKPSITCTEFAEDTDIYNCIEKYGITALMRKTEATDFLYDAYDNNPKTLMDRIQQRENINEYFRTLPANVRKQFGDSPEEFYQKYRQGDFETMLNKGILNEELAKRYMENLKGEENGTINENKENLSNTENIPTNSN